LVAIGFIAYDMRRIRRMMQELLAHIRGIGRRSVAGLAWRGSLLSHATGQQRPSGTRPSLWARRSAIAFQSFRALVNWAMAVLVTGSAGHLGEALMRTLRREGVPAVGLDRKASPFTDRVGSICDRAFVEDAMRGATAVVHAATLHKPHVATHSWGDFIDANVKGTLHLLEAAVASGVGSFVYLSTTSVFGIALTTEGSSAAIWVSEDLAPGPKNIYGVTKLMAESLCELTHRKRGLPVVILRTSRFFPEEDDDPVIRHEYPIANLQANEMLYRRVDMEDAVSAVKCALEKARTIRFGRYIVSATTPFAPADCALLGRDSAAAIRRQFPQCEPLFAARGWKLPPRLDRVYINRRAREELGWAPRYDFRYVLDCLASNLDFRSALALEVGSKGYHDRSFADCPYPVE
jgi:UDP-glucose 4-epimerase